MLERLGLQKTTLVDFPGRVAATIFTHGCPLRCPFCHNPELVVGPIPESFVARAEIEHFLEKRAPLLDGICITGGEPLIHQDLAEFLREIRSHELEVKLDTSGMFPDHLERLLSAGLVDFVALDFKTSPEHYHRVGGDGEALLRSIGILRGGGIEYEIRTTVAPGVVTEEDIRTIATHLVAGERYVLAQFRPGTTLDPLQSQAIPYRSERLHALCAEIIAQGKQCRLRGA